MNPTGVKFQNRILASLSREQLSRLAPHFTAMDLVQGHTLLQGNATHGYFLEAGIASVVIVLASGETVEVGVVGLEGVVGLPILYGSDSTPGRVFMQIGGSGYRIPATQLKQEFDKAGELRVILQKYMQAFLVQSSQTAACNRLHNIEERLSRWLLTCRDRMAIDELRLTQEFLGQMLGAPRTTVTLAAGLLQRAGLIHHGRGVVTIQNRSGLEKKACECYRVVRNEYQRLGLL